MSVASANLALALNELPFVQTIENNQQGQSISILCRIRPGTGGLWAALAEHILREADKKTGQPDYWHTHIARVYMLRSKQFVYGWAFVIQATDVDKTVPMIIDLIVKFGNAIAQQIPRAQPAPRPRHLQTQDDDFDPPEEINEDEDFSEPEGPLPQGAVPEADERGNPIVPREHRVKNQAMAGLSRNYDRNAPDPDKGKGSWHIESRKGKAFRPPVRR